MTNITFKVKPETIYNMDETVAYRRLKVPVLTTAHCNMSAMRQHKKFGSYTNSALFPNLLAKLRRERLGDYIRLDRPLPEGVTIDETGFLTQVHIAV